MQRRLAAIVHADLAGFTRLMEGAETRTFRHLKAAQNEVWRPAIEAGGGRLVGTAGDAMLASTVATTASRTSAGRCMSSTSVRRMRRAACCGLEGVDSLGQPHICEIATSKLAEGVVVGRGQCGGPMRRYRADMPGSASSATHCRSRIWARPTARRSTASRCGQASPWRPSPARRFGSETSSW